MCCTLLVDEKIRQSAAQSVFRVQRVSEPIWETTNRSPNIKCIVPAFFRDRFGGKEGEGGLKTPTKYSKLE
jgi:hypothetical protein